MSTLTQIEFAVRAWWIAFRGVLRDPRPFVAVSAFLLIIWGFALAGSSSADTLDLYGMLHDPLSIQMQGLVAVVVGIVGFGCATRIHSAVLAWSAFWMGAAWLWPATAFYAMLGISTALIYFGLALLNVWAIYRWFRINLSID